MDIIKKSYVATPNPTSQQTGKAASYDRPLRQESALREPSSTVSTNTPSTEVNISVQGQEKLAQEKRDIGQSILHSHQNQQNEKIQPDSTDPIDEVINNLKEQIEAIEQQLAELEGDNSTEAEEQRKQLNAQLLELNVSLLSLIEEKSR